MPWVFQVFSFSASHAFVKCRAGNRKVKMFPCIDRTVPHIEEKILSYLEPRDLAASMLVCKPWYRKARTLLYKRYVIIKRIEGTVPLVDAATERNLKIW